MLVKFGKSVKDVPLTEVTAENYICPKGEEKTYHCLIEIVKFDQNTGKRLSKPRVQKFGLKAFSGVSKQLKLQGYTITILHDPVAYAAKIEAEKAAAKAKAAAEAAAKAKAKADAKAAAKAKADDEAMAAEAAAQTNNDKA